MKVSGGEASGHLHYLLALTYLLSFRGAPIAYLHNCRHTICHISESDCFPTSFFFFGGSDDGFLVFKRGNFLVSDRFLGFAGGHYRNVIAFGN